MSGSELRREGPAGPDEVGQQRVGADRRRFAVVGIIVASVLFTSWYAGAEPSRLGDTDGLSSMSEMVSALFSPDLSADFLARIGKLALESLLIGALGMFFALCIGIVLAIAAVRFPSIPDAPDQRRWPQLAVAALRSGSRGILALFRSVPEIVWAFLFVRIFGLGPGPAVFAIAITFGGIIGKLFAELLEATDPEPARALRTAGASWFAVFMYGMLPQVRSQWVSYALFRLECAIRSASILGVVGAGGLGAEIDLSIRYFQYPKLATALLAVLAYVIALELLSITLRKLPSIWPTLLFAIGAFAGVLWLDIPWRELYASESLAQAGAFIRGFAEPTMDSGFLASTVRLTLITVAMAWCSTIVAGAIAFVLAPLSATTFTIRGYLDDAPTGTGVTRWLMAALIVPVRLTLQISRALPELVWALLFVLWVGPGPTAGILALTVHTVGILGRLYSDVLEEAEPAPLRVIEASGASRFARYLYGALPQAAGRILAFTLFRFEVNVRAAAMVGFVGAGGLGDALHTALSLFHMRDLATLLMVTLAVVLVVDAVGDRVRTRVLRAAGRRA